MEYLLVRADMGALGTGDLNNAGVDGWTAVQMVAGRVPDSVLVLMSRETPATAPTTPEVIQPNEPQTGTP